MLYFIFTWQKKIKIYIYYIYFEVYTKIRFVHVPCTAPPIFVLTVPLIILGPYLKEKCRNYTHLGGLFQYCNCQAPLISLSSGCRKLVTVTGSLLCPSGAHWSVGLWRERLAQALSSSQRLSQLSVQASGWIPTMWSGYFQSLDQLCDIS